MSRASIKAYQDKYGIDMWNAGLIDFLFFKMDKKGEIPKNSKGKYIYKEVPPKKKKKKKKK